MAIDAYLINTPAFKLSYLHPRTKSIIETPVRLPLICLKLCQTIPNLEAGFGYMWQSLEASESTTKFNIDFSQCRSLTQLKETLTQAGATKNAFSFVDGEAKNVVCGGTMLPP